MNDRGATDNTWYDSPFVKWSVGLLVLLAAAALISVLIMAGQMHRWLAGDTTIRLNLPMEGAFGLKAGDPVRILGTRAGTVNGIRVETPEDRAPLLYATVSLRDAFLPFVSDDSQAIIHKELGIAGQTFVEITRSTGQLSGDPPILTTTADRSALALLEEAVSQIRDEVLPAFSRLSQTVEALAGEGAGVGVGGTIDRIGSIATKIDRGEGVLGRLVNDEQLGRSVTSAAERAAAIAEQARPIVEDAGEISGDVKVLAQRLREQSQRLPDMIDAVQQSLDQAKELIGGVDAATGEMPAIMTSVRQASDQLPTTLIQLQTTLTEMEDLLEALQESWLIQGGEDRPSRLTPQEVAP